MPHPDRGARPQCAESVRVCAKSVARRARNVVAGEGSEQALRRIGRDISIMHAHQRFMGRLTCKGDRIAALLREPGTSLA